MSTADYFLIIWLGSWAFWALFGAVAGYHLAMMQPPSLINDQIRYYDRWGHMVLGLAFGPVGALSTYLYIQKYHPGALLRSTPYPVRTN